MFQNVATKIGKKLQVFIILKNVIQGKLLPLTTKKWWQWLNFVDFVDLGIFHETKSTREIQAWVIYIKKLTKVKR